MKEEKTVRIDEGRGVYTTNDPSEAGAMGHLRVLPLPKGEPGPRVPRGDDRALTMQERAADTERLWALARQRIVPRIVRRVEQATCFVFLQRDGGGHYTVGNVTWCREALCPAWHAGTCANGSMAKTVIVAENFQPTKTQWERMKPEERQHADFGDAYNLTVRKVAAEIAAEERAAQNG